MATEKLNKSGLSKLWDKIVNFFATKTELEDVNTTLGNLNTSLTSLFTSNSTITFKGTNTPWQNAPVGISCYHYESTDTTNITTYSLPCQYCEIIVIKSNGNRGIAYASDWRTGVQQTIYVNTLHDTWNGWRNLSYALSDSTSAGALTQSANIPTERDIYFGTPKINGSKTYNSNTDIYVPTSVGYDGQVLQSNGSGEPSWKYPVNRAYCYTAANTSEKVVSAYNDFDRYAYDGQILYVYFSYGNTITDGITLKLSDTNGNWAEDIRYLGTHQKSPRLKPATILALMWYQNYEYWEVVGEYYYDDFPWVSIFKGRLSFSSSTDYAYFYDILQGGIEHTIGSSDLTNNYATSESHFSDSDIKYKLVRIIGTYYNSNSAEDSKGFVVETILLRGSAGSTYYGTSASIENKSNHRQVITLPNGCNGATITVGYGGGSHSVIQVSTSAPFNVQIAEILIS